MPKLQDIERYLVELYGEGVEVEYFGDLSGFEAKGEKDVELKALGYGTPYLLVFKKDGDQREAVVSTMRFGRGFGHDYRSDRVDNLVLSFDTWNGLPRHVKVHDIGAFLRSGRLVSLGEFEEFFLLREKVEGVEYYKDLDRIYIGGTLSELDRGRVKALADYAADIHSVKREDSELYVRRIRDTVGHGECVFGLSDSYPSDTTFLRDGELKDIECKCVEARWKLRGRGHRLAQVHGDYHPWNILFKEGTDFTLLDRSRGEFGEPADDVSALSINYIFYSLRKYGELRSEFEDLYRLFMETYLDKTGDKELMEVLPLFYTFRCLVVASPLWYPNLSVDVRRKIFNFIHSVLDETQFDFKKVNQYLM